MGALTKSLQHSEAVANTAHLNALQVKAGGGLGLDMGGGLQGFDQWAGRAQNNERYNLFRGVVYAAINAIAMEGAGQPVSLSKVTGTAKKKKKLRMGTKCIMDKMLPAARAKAVDADIEIIKSHEFLDVLEVPNPIQNRYQLVYSFIANLLLTGWGYVVGGETEDDGFELYSLPTTWIQPNRDFTEFKIVNPKRPDAGVGGPTLGRENVAFAHLPNPSDPMSAMAPAGSQMQAIRVDDHIWTSRERFFNNGVFPSVIVTVGKDPMPGGDVGTRPRLTAPQRRQIYSTISKTMSGVYNSGNPAIVDGLIESITPFSLTQNEMGWEKSEKMTKQAILTAFCVHPYILGEAVGGFGSDQVKNIEKRFFAKVNIYLDMLGQVMTNFLGNVEGEDKLVVWWEKKEAVDEKERANNLFRLRANDDITQDEIRGENGFGPDEDRNQSVLGKSAPQVMKVLELLGAGTITSEQAKATLTAMGLPDEKAEEMSKPPEKEEAPEQPAEQGEDGAFPAALQAPAGKPPSEEEAVQGAATALESAVDYLQLSPKRLAHQIVKESK